MSDDIRKLLDRTLAEVGELYEFYVHAMWAFHVADQDQVNSPSSILVFLSDFGLEDSAMGGEKLRKRILKYEDDLRVLVFVQLVTRFEEFFFRLMEILLAERPERLPKDKKIKYGEIVGCTDFRELLERLIARELNDLKYMSVADWIERLKDMVNIDCPSLEETETVAEIKASRDLIIHNSGIINETYIRKAGSRARGKIGGSVRLSLPYL